jgi:polar amino acid transport system ATP-binding protein
VSEQPALLLEGVHKSFGENEVLKGIDLRVEPHEVVCLIGASGSGKSTLLRCVNLVEQIDSGRVVVAGEEITAEGVDANRIRRRIGIVYQSFNLFPHMTVLRNITLAPREALGTDRAEAEKMPARSWNVSDSWTSRRSTPTGSQAASSSGSP